MQNVRDLAGHERAAAFLRSLDPQQIRAALSKAASTSIGDLAIVLSRSLTHKHYSFADIEWMVAPPVLAGQFFVVEAAHREQGFRVPIAAATWAFVSDQIDGELQRLDGSRRRLRPSEWKSGANAWLIDAVGEAEGVTAALRWLIAGQFKDEPLKMIAQNENGTARITTVKAMLAEAEQAKGDV